MVNPIHHVTGSFHTAHAPLVKHGDIPVKRFQPQAQSPKSGSMLRALATADAGANAHIERTQLHRTDGDVRIIPFALPLDSSGQQAATLKNFYQSNGLMRLVTTDALHAVYHEPKSLEITQKLIHFYDQKFNLSDKLGMDRPTLERALLMQKGKTQYEKFQLDAGLPEKLTALTQTLKPADLQSLLQHLFGSNIALADDPLTHTNAHALTSALVQVARSEPALYRSLSSLGHAQKGDLKVEFGVYDNPGVRAGVIENPTQDDFEIRLAEPRIEDLDQRSKPAQLAVKLPVQVLGEPKLSDAHRIVGDHVRSANTAWGVLAALEKLGVAFKSDGKRISSVDMASDLFLNPENPVLKGLLPTQLVLSDSDPLVHLRNEARSLLKDAEGFDALYKNLGAEHPDVLKRANQFGTKVGGDFLKAVLDVINTHEWARDLLDSTDGQRNSPAPNAVQM